MDLQRSLCEGSVMSFNSFLPVTKMSSISAPLLLHRVPADHTLQALKNKGPRTLTWVVPMLIVVASGVVQMGRRRASFSDALSLVLAKRRPRCGTCCRVPLSAPCAAPNPTSSYLPQAGHPVSAVIKCRATAACSRTSGSLDEPRTYFSSSASSRP